MFTKEGRRGKVRALRKGGVAMAHTEVYRVLARANGDFVSGQSLSRTLGVSRAAVWKAVEALRREGYDVEARSGLGYRLRGGDRLDEALVSAALGDYSAPVHVLSAVDSTNNYCKLLAAQGAPDGTVVIADSQTAGRGRRGRGFLSPAGQGLYLSVLWRPECAPDALLPLTALSAVAVSRAVERLGGEAPGIKWPNDLVLAGRKICGILTELSVEAESGLVDYVVVGIGVNCRQQPTDFPEELQTIAGSLDMGLSAVIPRAALAAELVRQLHTLRREVLFAPGTWLEAYRSRCLTVGKRVRLFRGEDAATATALAVDGQYGLVVAHDDGSTETLRSGEVSVRGLYGYMD